MPQSCHSYHRILNVLDMYVKFKMECKYNKYKELLILIWIRKIKRGKKE